MNEIELNENGEPPETAVDASKETEVAPKTKEERPRRKSLILIALLLLLLAALAIGLGVGLGRQSSKSVSSEASGLEGGDEQSLSNESPTPPPVVADTDEPPTPPPVVEDTNVPPTLPPVAAVVPTSPPVTNVAPTSPPVTNVAPTSPPVVDDTNVAPTSPPVVDDTNVPPTSPPVVDDTNVPPTLPPVVDDTNVPPTLPPVVEVPPTQPPVAEEDPVLDVTPFISEFHYDNVGGDEGHVIEIAAPYGLDVSNLIVEFYRSDGTVYQVQPMSGFTHGTISGGLAFWSKQLDSMLNGPNGIALGTDRSSGFELIEFISYEGTIEGTQGIALGATSVDIGVVEGDDTPIGFSLQKGGEGCNGGDFEWQAATLAETAGAVNEGMTVTCGGVDATAPPTPTPVCTLRVLTADEISEHDTEDDLWLILHGTVYDLTYYAPTHKGTPEVIYAMGGQDATAQFDSALALDHHHTEGKLFRTFRTNIVGIVGDESGELEIECDETLRDYSPYTSQ